MGKEESKKEDKLYKVDLEAIKAYLITKEYHEVKMIDPIRELAKFVFNNYLTLQRVFEIIQKTICVIEKVDTRIEDLKAELSTVGAMVKRENTHPA